MPKSNQLTIITRTSARPTRFLKLVQSIATQTYPNIHHLVLCDNSKAFEYATRILKNNQRCPFTVHMVQKSSQARAFYNLYLNKGIELVEDGYILFVDDDDHLVNATCIAEFWNHPKPDDGFYIVQFLRGTKPKPNPTLFPNHHCQAGDTSGIRPGRIGGSCIIFTAQHAINAHWDDQLASDFRFIMQLAKKNSFTFIPVKIVQATPTGNKGVLYD